MNKVTLDEITRLQRRAHELLPELGKDFFDHGYGGIGMKSFPLRDRLRLALPYGAGCLAILAGCVAGVILGKIGFAAAGITLCLASLAGLFPTMMMALTILASEGTYPDIAQFFRVTLKERRRLKKDIQAFLKALENLHVLAGRTPLVDEVLTQSGERLLELQQRRHDLFRPLKELEDRLRKEDETHYLRLQAAELKKHLPALLSSTSSGKLTKDVTPYVAMLQAEDHLDQQAQGLPTDGSLWEPEADASAPPYHDRDRE